MKLCAVLVWLVLAITAVYAMFHVTFKVDEVTAELHGLNRQVAKEREAIHVLGAEWAYLSNPARIEELAANLLPWLQPVGAPQIQPLEALPARLPDEPDPSTPVDPAPGGPREALDKVTPASSGRVQIGRASCRDRVCQYVSISVVAVSLTKKQANVQYYIEI